MAHWCSVLASEPMNAFLSSQPRCFQWHFYRGQDNPRPVGNPEPALLPGKRLDLT